MRLEEERRADDFAHGRFSLLLREASHAVESQRCTRDAADTFERRGQHRVVWRRVRFPEDKSWLEQVWLQRRRQHSTSCKGRGPNSKCDRFLPPSSHSSPNIHWSWISASSQNVFRLRRQEGLQGREGAATRCGGCVWTIMRSSSCSSGPRTNVPDGTRVAFMSATMTALLQKPDGGVRRIATGTSFKRLVA